MSVGGVDINAGGIQPVTPGQTGGVQEGPAAKGLNRKITPAEVVRQLAPGSTSAPAAPPPPPLHGRNAEAVAGKAIIGQSDSAAAAPAEGAEQNDASAEAAQKSLSQKIKHFFGEIKRIVLHEKWRQVPEDDIKQLPDELGSLKKRLTARNAMISDLAVLKERKAELSARVEQFAEMHKTALSLLKKDSPPNSSRVYVGGDGEEYCFKELIGRSDRFEKFKASFTENPEYQAFQKDRKELARIPEERQQLKNFLNDDKESLKLEIDLSVDRLQVLGHEKLDKQIQDHHSTARASIEEKRKEHQASLIELREEVDAKREQLSKQKARREFIAQYKKPRLSQQLRTAQKQAAKRLKMLEQRVKDPVQLKKLTATAMAANKKTIDKLSETLRDLNAELVQYEQTRSQFKEELKTAEKELKKREGDKGTKKEIEGIRKEDRKFTEKGLKKHQKIPDEAAKQVKSLHNAVRGRP